MIKRILQRGVTDKFFFIYPLIVSVLSAVILLGMLRGYCEKLGGNVGSFICIGDRFIPPEKLGPGVPYLKNSAGYDGQFFYLIAKDPWIQSDQYKHIDSPVYRYQRIFYPFLIHMTAGGGARKYPERMVQVNFFAIVLGTFALAQFLGLRGRSPLWAFVFTFLGGNLLGLFRDLADPLALTLLLLAFLQYESQFYWRCALFLCLAMLTKEVFSLVAGLMVLDQWIKQRHSQRAAVCATSLIPFLLWHGYICFRFGKFFECSGSGNIGFPFLGLAHKFLSGCAVIRDGHCVAAFVLVLFFTLFSAVREVRRCADAPSMAFLLFSLLPFIGSHSVWPEPWAYGRLLLPSAGLLLFCYARSGRRWDWIPLFLNLVATMTILRWLFRG